MSKLHFLQKVILCSILLVINLILAITSIVYYDYWYIFIVPLSLSTTFNCVCVLLIIAFKIKSLVFKENSKCEDVENTNDNNQRNIAFLVPCYNENKDELTKTISSLKNQTGIEGHKKVLMIVCDGKVRGSTSEISTDKILKEMLQESAFGSLTFTNAYKTWSGEHNTIEIIYGTIDNLPYLTIIKNKNVGKRDSLVLIKSLLYKYNNKMSKCEPIESTEEYNLNLSDVFDQFFTTFLQDNDFTHFDYIIGTDADTEFAPDCSYHLINSIDTDPLTHGVVGFVEVSKDCNPWSFWTLYQRSEYIVTQCLRRLQQSIVTNKVTCLSGCVQILRVSKEVCGKRILDKFNYFPKEDNNVWKHILSFASEDRNHVCQMLHMYPYVKTKQCLDALSYTIIPNNFTVFKSQRRRWSLGSISNDLLLCYKSGIDLFERIGAIFNVLTYSMCLFIFVATITFIYSVIVHPNIIMLYLATLIFIPMLYDFLIVFWYKFESGWDRLRFFIGLLLYITISPFLNLFITAYSLVNLDYFKWGKTRTTESNEPTDNYQNQQENNSNLDPSKITNMRKFVQQKHINKKNELQQEKNSNTFEIELDSLNDKNKDNIVIVV